MGDERAPYLCFDTVFCLRIKVMELEVIFELLEHSFDAPTIFKNEGNLLRGNFKVIGYKLVSTSFFVFVRYFTQA